VIAVKPAARGPLNASSGRLLLRLAALLAVTLALKSFIVDPLTGHFAGSFEDFSAYMGAARAMAHGGSPYAQFDPSTVVMSGFIYPPFAALLLRPLALLDDRQALSIWLGVTLACSLAGAVIVARGSLPARWPRDELAVLAALAFAPVAYNYWHGQINPVVFLLLAVAFRQYVSGRQVSCGAILGLAAGIKVAPLVLAVLLLRRRWWRGSLAMLAATGLTFLAGYAVLGGAVTQHYLQTIFPTLNRGAGWIYNQSLGGVVARLGGHSVLNVDAPSLLIQLAGLAAGAALLTLTAWAVRPDRERTGDRGMEFGLGVLAMLLAGSLAWFPHFTHLLIPLFACLGFGAARGWWRQRRVVLPAAATAVAFGIVAPLAISMMNIHWIGDVSHTSLWWAFLQLTSIPALISLWLAVEMARSLRTDRSNRDTLALT
jgi:alpha-1,2-mannosyltransferase